MRPHSTAMAHPTQQPTPPVRRPDLDELSAPATQIVRDRDAYLGQSRDIGRRLTDDQVELFVADDPALALQREIERLAPQYLALHDVGTSSSLRLLQAMAATTGKVMRLTIRRQGQGVPLATLQFVEIGGSDGSALRVYSTDIDADSHARHQIARVLVSHARLAVLVFGELPGHALAAAVQPMIDAASHDRWPNRHMLMIPLGAPAPVSSFAHAFGHAGLHVQVTPRVARPADAWTYIGSTWNQLEGVAPPPPAPAPAAVAAAVASPAPRPAATDDDEEPTQPMGLGKVRGGINWFDYVQRCASIKGMVSCCVFDRGSGKPLAHAGGLPPAEVMRSLGEQLLSTAGEVSAMMGAGTHVLEASFSTPTHHVLLRSLPSPPGVVLHAVLDAVTGNPTLARAQLQRLDPG